MTIVAPSDKIFKGTKRDDVRPRSVSGSEDSERFVPILALECRGIEPYKFHSLGGEFFVTSEAGAKLEGMEDLILTEDDFADYDDVNEISISILDFKSKFVRV
mmetsp:Transcript_40430/g.94989  ORF Transcript_40430/g.94989 Transcript_40430/m.94989 type:complete len:103 (-) Transcript_40430:132-440(-)